MVLAFDISNNTEVKNTGDLRPVHNLNVQHEKAKSSRRYEMLIKCFLTSFYSSQAVSPKTGGSDSVPFILSALVIDT